MITSKCLPTGWEMSGNKKEIFTKEWKAEKTVQLLYVNLSGTKKTIDPFKLQGNVPIIFHNNQLAFKNVTISVSVDYYMNANILLNEQKFKVCRQRMSPMSYEPSNFYRNDDSFLIWGVDYFNNTIEMNAYSVVSREELPAKTILLKKKLKEFKSEINQQLEDARSEQTARGWRHRSAAINYLNSNSTEDHNVEKAYNDVVSSHNLIWELHSLQSDFNYYVDYFDDITEYDDLIYRIRNNIQHFKATKQREWLQRWHQTLSELL